MSTGKILLVSLGPGTREHMTLRAHQAIVESDVVIGYATYIKLLTDLLDGKEVVRKSMTQEIGRCVEAYEQAKLGKRVALVSSGDVGIYGMAGLAYEVLLQRGWTPTGGIEVEVIPGSTALSACASLVGAPLTHDLCTISLSDLLTPWPRIAKRIDAAGRSDFVIALYNPRSGRRTQQIAEAQRLLLQYRRADTPVAIVKSAYREAQDAHIARLDEMQECDIGMLTTVLIGNSSSYVREGLMITPRGYTNKYDRITGGVKSGERAGRSLNMGLAGWKACVRKYLRDGNGRSLREIARHFDVPMGEIFSAISEAEDGQRAGDHAVVEVPSGAELATLEATHSWGRVRVVVRSEAGAVSELLLDGDRFSRRGNWVSVENEHFHLHIDWSRVRQAWLARHGESHRGMHFADAGGHIVFNLSLTRRHGRFETEAEQHFERVWRQFAEDGETSNVVNDQTPGADPLHAQPLIANPGAREEHLLQEAMEQGPTRPAGIGEIRFGDPDRNSLYRIIAARRDMRHFVPGAIIEEETLARVLEAAHRAPSVGLMQPWRFIRVRNDALRGRIADIVAREREATAAALGDRKAEFLRLKVEGIRECAELLVVALAPDDGTVFGRRTMPQEMALCSVACAIQNLWLAARAENLGLGWVSMFDPAALASLLGLPPDAKLAAILCLGPVDSFYERPMLEQEGWRQGRALHELVFQDHWNNPPKPRAQELP